MAMISPMIIFQITKRAEESGKSAGSIYALSTSGGIVFTLLFGFFIIPEYGISYPVRILGLFVSLIAIGLLIYQKFSVQKVLTSIVVIFVASTQLYNNGKDDSSSQFNVLETSEGLLGELKVVDQPSKAPNGASFNMRSLRTNNVPQNSVVAEMSSQSLLYYVNFTKQLLTTFPNKNSALLVGLGAGSLYKIMSDQFKTVESVELDKRIYDYGVQYFGMREHDNVIDDGRHFINTCDKKYDLIMLDVIVGENVPEQMISKECFKKCYEMLNENGKMIIENGSVFDFQHNSFAPSIVKTLNAAGFEVNLFNPLKSNQQGDIIFVASKSKFNFDTLSIKDDVLVEGGLLSKYTLTLESFNTGTAKIFTDDLNFTDKFLKSHYLTIREKLRESLKQELAYQENN